MAETIRSVREKTVNRATATITSTMITTIRPAMPIRNREDDAVMRCAVAIASPGMIMVEMTPKTANPARAAISARPTPPVRLARRIVSLR
jgi:hypothetical protein